MKKKCQVLSESLDELSVHTELEDSEVMVLKQKVKDQDQDICILQNSNLKLEEHIENVNDKSYSAVAAVFKSVTRTYAVAI